MFTMTVKQARGADLAREEALESLSLLLLPKVTALWEVWVESGLLTIEDGEGGQRWKVNAAGEGTDDRGRIPADWC